MSPIAMNAAASALSALDAYSAGMAAVAHNIANVNTAGYRSVRVNYETGPGGYGVRPEVVPPSGPASVPLPPDPAMPTEMMFPSNTELAREFVTMISTQRAYDANAVSIRTWDQMTGVLLDLKV